MSDTYAEDFFVINRWILKCAGMWRPETKNENIRILYTAYVTGIFLFVNIFFTGTEFLSLISTFGHEYDFIKNVSFLLTHLMGAVKVVFFYFCGDKLKKIMSTLENSELRYGSCPKKGFFPGAISESFKKVGIRYTLLFFMLAHATLMSSYVPPLITAVRHIEGNLEKPLPERLPYYSWMPFRFDTAGLYIIALGYQAIPMFSYAYSIVGMDTLFMNMMNCIGMNLEIVQGAFLTVHERVSENIIGPLLSPDGLYNSEKLRIALNHEMKKISIHLQIIYE
ncbi:unnamed protein product [Phaedon cochleariae]|uniref:Odorant receptor n=1 Tax=Phaedon cochleariae TaxID=80249 RepID=A0A9N9X2T6_PHACE|nr:unnamed protein product [Phaedon cochleariae]